MNSDAPMYGCIPTYVDYKLKLYTGLSPSDINAIAKDIKRSPHRVRQALQSLNRKWSNISTRIGKIARGVTIVALIVSVAYALASGVQILDIVAGYIVEGLVELTKWLVSEGLKKLISLIPAVGALLGFFLGKLISIALNAILSTKFVKSIREKFQKKVNAKTYKVWDYLVAYFKCWA